MIWGEIKHAINSRIGTLWFKSLDKIVEEQAHETYYSTMESYVSAYGDNDGKIFIIPRGTESIEDGMFNTSQDVRCIVLPNGLKKIGDSAFLNDSIKTIILPKSIQTIGENAFSFSLIKYIDIPEGVSELKNGTFSSCKKLKNIVLPSTLEVIGGDANFDGLDALESIKIFAKSPPVIEGDFAFDSTDLSGCTLYVPNDSIDLYKYEPYWSDFGEIIGI